MKQNLINNIIHGSYVCMFGFNVCCMSVCIVGACGGLMYVYAG